MSLFVINFALVLVVFAVCVSAKSYSIDYVVSEIHLPSSGCKMIVNEEIRVKFSGSYSFMTRAFPRELSYASTFSINKVTASDGIIVTSSGLQNSKDGLYHNIFWKFIGVPDSGPTYVSFYLTYQIGGYFQNIDATHNKLSWYYSWDTTIGQITNKVIYPTKINNSSIVADPIADASVSSEQVVFNHGNVPAGGKYITYVTVPSTGGEKWSECKIMPASLGDLAITGIAVGIAVAVCCCCFCICFALILARNYILDALGIGNTRYWGSRFSKIGNGLNTSLTGGGTAN